MANVRTSLVRSSTAPTIQKQSALQSEKHASSQDALSSRSSPSSLASSLGAVEALTRSHSLKHKLCRHCEGSGRWYAVRSTATPDTLTYEYHAQARPGSTRKMACFQRVDISSQRVQLVWTTTSRDLLDITALATRFFYRDWGGAASTEHAWSALREGWNLKRKQTTEEYLETRPATEEEILHRIRPEQLRAEKWEVQQQQEQQQPKRSQAAGVGSAQGMAAAAAAAGQLASSSAPGSPSPPAYNSIQPVGPLPTSPGVAKSEGAPAQVQAHSQQQRPPQEHQTQQQQQQQQQQQARAYRGQSAGAGVAPGALPQATMLNVKISQSWRSWHSLQAERTSGASSWAVSASCLRRSRFIGRQMSTYNRGAGIAPVLVWDASPESCDMAWERLLIKAGMDLRGSEGREQTDVPSTKRAMERLAAQRAAAALMRRPSSHQHVHFQRRQLAYRLCIAATWDVQVKSHGFSRSQHGVVEDLEFDEGEDIPRVVEYFWDNFLD